MAVLKDLIVHGSSRFLNAAYYNKIKVNDLAAEEGYFNKLVAVSGKITDLNVDDLTAQNATVIGLLDVKGELHTNSWTNANIATIDGSFYITPTVSCESGTFAYDGTNITVTAGSNQSFGVDNLYTYTTSGSATTYTSWPQYSRVLLTGEVKLNGSNEWQPLGTIRGQIVSSSTSSIKINSLYDSQGASSIATLTNLGSTSISNASFRKVKISLYERASNSTSFFPIGIYMTALGSKGKTFIDIYGGGDAKATVITNSIDSGAMAKPVLRIGNLSGLPTLGTVTPSGWGIYTTNGFFTGTIVAKQGKIGDGTAAWTIGNDGDNRAYIWSGIQNITSTGSTTGIYVGTNGISNYQSTTQYVNITGGKITAQGVDITGKIVASSGTIGGWTINSSYGIYTNSKTSATSTNSGILIQKDGGIYAGAYNSTSQACPFQVTSAGALTATNAQIFGDLTANTLTVGASGDSNHLIYSGGTIDLSTDWLKFDSSTQTILIGKKVTTTSLQTKIDSDTFWITNGTDDIAFIGNENKTITDTFVSDGSTLTYDLSSTWLSGGTFSPASVTGSKVSGENKISVNSGTLPAAGQTFTYTYTPSSAVTYYTMGTRNSSTGIGDYSFAEGNNVTASGKYSHAEGFETRASGLYSHAEGARTTASGRYSHTEGAQTTASGFYSHAEGARATASGSYSHAEGYTTTASGWASHAEGIDTVASGRASSASGIHTNASDFFGSANGTLTKARAGQFVIGVANIEDTGSGGYIPYTSVQTVDLGQYAFIIGNGHISNDSYLLSIDDESKITRSNALTVDWDGALTTASDIWAKKTSSEVQVGVDGAGGRLYMYSSPTSSRTGIYAYNAQNESVDVLTVDNNQDILLGVGHAPIWLYKDPNGASRCLMPQYNDYLYLGATSYRWKVCYLVQGNNISSDLKYKSVVKDFDWKIDDFIRGLKPIAYKRIAEDGTIASRISLGFGAQDVAKLSDKLEIGNLSLYEASIIEEDEDGVKKAKSYHGEKIDDSKLDWSLKYSDFIAPMVLEIQRLMDRVDKLESEIKALKS